MKNICLLLVLPLVFVSQAALAENGEKIKPTIEYEYYDVNIEDESRIVDAAFKATPIRIGGKRFLGETRCQTGFDYSPQKLDGSLCAVADYNITLDCVITLPRFNGGGPELREKLNVFLEKINAHEQRHYDIFLEHAEKLAQWMSGGLRLDCNSLGNTIRTAFNKSNNECLAVQKKYDRETIHGQTEGADLEWQLGAEEDRHLMGENMTAPAIEVKPAIEYVYYDVPVEDPQSLLWRRDHGRLDWSFGYGYKPRRKIDETCRIMKYDVELGCKINLPRFSGDDPGQFAGQEEKAKKVQLERCDLIVNRINRFVKEISGEKTFNCERMGNSITGLKNQTMADIKEALKEYDQRLEGPDGPSASPFREAEPKISYKHYDVPVKEAESALAAALNKSRTGRNGQKAASGLQWKWGYSYTPVKKADSSCQVAEYETTLECEITLPSFQSRDENLLKEVEALAEGLKEQELKRCRRVKAQADKFARWLSSDQSFSCGPMGNKIRGEFNQLFRAVEEDLKSYDPAKD